MNAPADPPSPPASALISVRAGHRVATLRLHDDVLILVRRGRKTLYGGAGEVRVGPGEAVLMPRGTVWDVHNQPDAGGRYEARVLVFGDALLAEAAALEPGLGSPSASDAVPAALAPLFAPAGALAEMLERAADGLADPTLSPRLQRHRVLEVLLWLAEGGCCPAPRAELSWPERVRRLVAARPQADWSVATLAGTLAVSASTLRRRLDEHGQSIAALVREARLELALGLLQTTALPVGEIAGRCGYASPSRFAAAFRRRFGFAPSLLRQPDADGTAIDASGLTVDA